MCVCVCIYEYSAVCEINESGLENWKYIDFHFVPFHVCLRKGVRL